MAWQHTRRTRWMPLSGCLIAVLLLVSCSGPAEFTDEPPPATSTQQVPSTATPDTDTTTTAADDVTPTLDADPTPTEEATPDASPTPSPEPTPEVEPTPTEEPEPTPTVEPVTAMEALPRLEELTEGGFVVADQGDRTAEQLARAYADPTAHLMRLEEWGFQQHVFREFTRNETGPDDTLPGYVLATVNVYGSVEQADLALQWLEDFQANQGATIVDPPDLGDAAVALTVPTAQGEQTASIYARLGDRIYIYYAQGREPLNEVSAIAERVFDRLQNQGQVV